MNPRLYFIVTNTDTGYERPTESVRVVVCDTPEQAMEEAQKMTSMFTYAATVYEVTENGYRGERIAVLRHQR